MGIAQSVPLSAASPALWKEPDGVSWQATLLNFFFRHVLKSGASIAGISQGSTHVLTTVLETLNMAFSGMHPAHRAVLGDIPCDIVYPPEPPPVEQVVLYLHGGGFCVHLPGSYRRFARRLARTFGATVYLPDYRLAPKHRYPAAHDDCFAAYRALIEEGCDPARLCIMGDSAGGNLALATLLRARDAGLPMPACGIVLSPGADLTLSGNSYVRNAEADPFVAMSALRQVAAQYIDKDQAEHPYASPVKGDFSGLPPIQILVGSTEVLLDSSITIAESCYAVGVDVILHVWQDMPHVFPIFGFLPEARSAIAQMASFFTKHVTPTHGVQ